MERTTDRTKNEVILNPIARTCELQKPRGENSLIATNLRNVVHQFCEFGRLQLYQHHCPLHSTKGGLLFYAEAAAAVAVGGRPKTTPRLDRILGVGIPFIVVGIGRPRHCHHFHGPLGLLQSYPKPPRHRRKRCTCRFIDRAKQTLIVRKNPIKRTDTTTTSIGDCSIDKFLRRET